MEIRRLDSSNKGSHYVYIERIMYSTKGRTLCSSLERLHREDSALALYDGLLAGAGETGLCALALYRKSGGKEELLMWKARGLITDRRSGAPKPFPGHLTYGEDLRSSPRDKSLVWTCRRYVHGWKQVEPLWYEENGLPEEKEYDYWDELSLPGTPLTRQEAEALLGPEIPTRTIYSVTAAAFNSVRLTIESPIQA